jgi:hypothetical protein
MPAPQLGGSEPFKIVDCIDAALTDAVELLPMAGTPEQLGLHPAAHFMPLLPEQVVLLLPNGADAGALGAPFGFLQGSKQPPSRLLELR